MDLQFLKKKMGKMFNLQKILRLDLQFTDYRRNCDGFAKLRMFTKVIKDCLGIVYKRLSTNVPKDC